MIETKISPRIRRIVTIEMNEDEAVLLKQISQNTNKIDIFSKELREFANRLCKKLEELNI
jgi:hypothetical protein